MYDVGGMERCDGGGADEKSHMSSPHVSGYLDPDDSNSGGFDKSFSFNDIDKEVFVVTTTDSTSTVDHSTIEDDNIDDVIYAITYRDDGFPIVIIIIIINIITVSYTHLTLPTKRIV